MTAKIRKIGIITKGIVYSLLGILTFLASIGYGGKISGKNEVILFLEDQVLGNILLILLSVGLFCYSYWKLYSAFLDGKNEGTDKFGITKRIGYFFSGLMYATLAISIILRILKSNSGNNTKQTATRTLLESDGGVLLLSLISAILFGVGIYQIHKGYSQKFLKNINFRNTNNAKEILSKIGTSGYIARGISFLIFSFFVFTALKTNESQKIKGIQVMFNFLHSFAWGNILMGLMSLGFLCYGVYQYFLARHSSLH